MIGRIRDRRKRPRSRARIFLVGYYGMRNTGDEAIREAIEGGARALGVRVAHFATRDHGRSSPRAVPISGFGMFRYLAAIVTADRVVLGGGGILKDEGLRLSLELFVTAVVARLLGKPVALLAVGVGPFYTRAGRWIIAATARLASVRTVRDAASRQALSDLGVGRVFVGADPTYAHMVQLPPRPAGAGAPEARRVVVSVRPWFLRDAEREDRQRAFRDAVATGIVELVEAGWQARLISLYWPRDHTEARTIAADTRLGSAHVREGELSWADLVAEIEAADLVIAMRYHAVVAASLVGRPTIALAYEPKVTSLATELGLPIIAVDDPNVADQLRAAVRAYLDGVSDCLPDARAVEGLRARSRLALEAALVAPADGRQRGA